MKHKTLTLLVTGTGKRTNETETKLLLRTDDATLHFKKDSEFGKLAHALVDTYNERQISAKELACKMVGDGKRPNKYFVTIAYGYYFPIGKDDDMDQAPNSLESSTIFFDNKQEAEDFFENIPMPTYRTEITGKTIAQIMIEDRLTGVVKERFYKEIREKYFIRQTY